jgi:hypothetical protein
MRVNELIEQLVNADPDSVVLYLDPYADVEESDEISEVSVDSRLWTHEKGVRHGESYENRYPYGPLVSDGEGHEVLSQSIERVVVLSNGPTNLRYLPLFQPDERQQALIERARTSHRWAQAFGRYAPSRLVRKWTSENPTPTNEDRPAQRKKRRFLGVSKSSSRGLVTVPRSVRSALRLRAGTRLWWYLSGDSVVCLKAETSCRLHKGSKP